VTINTRINWLILLVCLALSAHECRAQEPSKSICGLQTSNAKFDLIAVACLDTNALRGLGVPIPPGTADRQTQVLLHIREGDAVRVTVDGVAKFADISIDAWGRRVALVVFDGVEHADVNVRVYRAVEQ
jgi:hypothetical protein